MLKFFSAPIFAGIILGTLFPYKSLSLIGLSSVLLFALLFVNTLVVDGRQILAALKSHGLQIAGAQFLIFVFFPVLLTAVSSLVIRDGDFLFGMAMSTLAPCALVNPFFARHRSGLPAVALASVILSTILTPFLTLPMLHLLSDAQVFIEPRALFQYLLALAFLPVFASLFVGTLWPKVSAHAGKWLPILNSLLLAVLMFILVGSSLNRLPSRTLISADLAWMVGFYAVMDFGLFWLVGRIALWFMPKAEAETMALSVATRNFALTASLLLFFHPKAALPSAVGLIVHCLFFQWLIWQSSDKLKTKCVTQV